MYAIRHESRFKIDGLHAQYAIIRRAMICGEDAARLYGAMPLIIYAAAGQFRLALAGRRPLIERARAITR